MPFKKGLLSFTLQPCVLLNKGYFKILDQISLQMLY